MRIGLGAEQVQRICHLVVSSSYLGKIRQSEEMLFTFVFNDIRESTEISILEKIVSFTTKSFYKIVEMRYNREARREPPICYQ